jgi:hypothetical protein
MLISREIFFMRLAKISANKTPQPTLETRAAELPVLGRLAMEPQARTTAIAFLLAELSEYRRPWKIITLIIGIALLIAGSFYFSAPDWDIGISLVMAIPTFLTAPLSIRIILERRWALFPFMFVFTWFSVDGCYWLYWHFKNPAVLHLMRGANFTASLVIYGLCGMFWLYRGSLRQFSSELLALCGFHCGKVH